MQEPEKPDTKNLEEGLKGIDLDKFGDATRKMMQGLNDNKADEAARKTLKKGVAFFKKAKDALKGDESAKEHMAKTENALFPRSQQFLAMELRRGVQITS